MIVVCLLLQKELKHFFFCEGGDARLRLHNVRVYIQALQYGQME